MMCILVYYSLIFIFGLTVGSFLNCVIYRLEKGEGFLRGRSHCPYCKKTLSWRDLIPLLSFIVLWGRCRYCQRKISWQYPLVEFFTGILFVLIFSLFIYDLQFIIYITFVVCLLMIIFVYDLKHFIIPDRVIFLAIAIVFIYRILEAIGWNSFGSWKLPTRDLSSILGPLLSAASASLFFLIIFLVSQGKWMGFGDVKLAFFMGLFLGFPNILLALFLAFSIGAIIGIGLMIGRKKTWKSEVPFGPFLVTGTLLSLFWGREIINWFLNFI